MLQENILKKIFAVSFLLLAFSGNSMDKNSNLEARIQSHVKKYQQNGELEKLNLPSEGSKKYFACILANDIEAMQYLMDTLPEEDISARTGTGGINNKKTDYLK